MKNIPLIIVVFWIMLISVNVSAAEVYLGLMSHGSRIDIGLAGFVPKTPTVEESKTGRALTDVLRYDLLFTRIFNILDNGPGYFGRQEDAKNWSDRGADVIIAGDIVENKDKIIVEAKLIDTMSNQIIWKKEYKSDKSDYRYIAHEINDEVVLRFTGEKGIAHTKIAFVNNSDNNKEIYIIDYDGYNLKKITNDRSINILPEWPPDGKEIFYTTYKYSNPDLYAIDYLTGKTRAVSTYQGLNTAPAFSSDGKKIVITLSKGSNPDLYLISDTGKILKKLTFDKGIETSPSFAPNNQEIVYISDLPGYPQLYIMNLDGGNKRRLPAEGFCDSPSWSPRGDKIVFTMRQKHSKYDLYIYDLNTSRVFRLTQDEGNNENPSWSPDGRFIVFSSNRTGRRQLYIIAVDGSGLRKLGNIKGTSFTPSWSP